MSLNIKNERTVQLVRQLAALTGESQTGAVEHAVRARLDELRAAGATTDAERARRDRARRAVAAVRETVAESAVAGSWREYEASELYDDWGSPR